MGIEWLLDKVIAKSIKLISEKSKWGFNKKICWFPKCKNSCVAINKNTQFQSWVDGTIKRCDRLEWECSRYRS